MALRRYIMAIVAAATLLGMSVLSGLGHDGQAGQDPPTALFSVSIMGGGRLAASLASAPHAGFGNHNQVSLTSDQVATGALTLTLLDMRGLASGWTVLLATVDFSNPAGHTGADALVLSPGEVWVSQGNPDLSGFSTFESGKMSTTSMPILSTAPQAGDGEYEFGLNGSLAFPQSSSVGVYTLLLTIQGTAP